MISIESCVHDSVDVIPVLWFVAESDCLDEDIPERFVIECDFAKYIEDLSTKALPFNLQLVEKS